MLPRGRAALVLVGVIATVVGAAAQTTGGTFGIGVLRRDGIVVPFADFDGKKWRSNWPQPREQVDVPIHVRDVPSRWWGKTGPHDAWQVWVASEPARTVHVLQPDWIPVQCRQQVGLRTDYRSAERPPDPGTQPFPKDGLAVAPPQPIERIEVVPVGHLSPEPVVDAFNDAEQQLIRMQRDRAGRLPDRSKRARTAPKVEAIYGVGDPNGQRVYYFEVSRQYTDAQAPDCPVVTFGAGWFVRDGAGSLRKLRFDADLVDCERYGLLYMLPLGAIRLSNRLFWIAQWSGWDFEEYGVVEIKPKGIDDVVQV